MAGVSGEAGALSSAAEWAISDACDASAPATAGGSISNNPPSCAGVAPGSSAVAARGARRAALPSGDAPSALASSAPTAASTTSGNSKPCSVPWRISIFIASSVARVGSSGNRSSVLSSRETSLSCARRCAERAARASFFSVSVETVASRRFFEAARPGRDCLDTAESAIEKKAVVAGSGRRHRSSNAIGIFRDRIVAWRPPPPKPFGHDFRF